MTAVLYVVVLYAAVRVGWNLAVSSDEARRCLLRTLPLLTVIVLTVTGLCTLAQFVQPAVLQHLRRSGPALHAGQWWRLGTPLLVQDGGVAGSLFNLATLAIVGTLAEQVLGRWRWLLLYGGTGLAPEVIAYSLMQQQGYAGNSIANFGLAAGLLVTAVTTRQRPAVLSGLVGMLAGGVLLVLGDLHGAAFVVGTLLASLVLVVHHYATERWE